MLQNSCDGELRIGKATSPPMITVKGQTCYVVTPRSSESNYTCL
jgi:hypothetical protein